MNKYIKNMALAAAIVSGLGFSQAEAAAISINVGNVAISISDGKVACNSNVRRVDNKREMDKRREMERRKEAQRRDMRQKDDRRKSLADNRKRR